MNTSITLYMNCQPGKKRQCFSASYVENVQYWYLLIFDL